MDSSIAKSLRIGNWRVDPGSDRISRNGETVRLDTRAMRLLICIAGRAGEVVSIDELLDQVWAGVTVSQDSVYQAVASLRRQLGDDPKEPKYIETVPRLGYRLIAPVAPWVQEAAYQGESAHGSQEKQQASERGRIPRFNSRFKARFVWPAGAALCLLLGIGGWALLSHPAARTGLAPQTQMSIAVLPFLDLTQGMKEEEFADGMTEELIDRLSKVGGLRVPAPTSSFYFKGKQIPPAEMAKALGVTYLLDGSVRKAGGRVRVAARLLRADNGYVVWTDTYDRPFNDVLMVQDDIAREVAKALRASIGGMAQPVTSK